MTKVFLPALLVLFVLLIFSRQQASPPPASLLLIPSLTPTPALSPSPTSTPALTFSQMNSLYGPCLHLPVLMYHHIQPEAQARQSGQVSLSVFTPIFRSHLEYLKASGYQPLSIATLLAFFKNHQIPPPKSVLLTFDDGYTDFLSDAIPLLKEFNYPSVLFVPTGLVNNPGYLSWSDIQSLSRDSQVYIGNHTWSHYNLAGTDITKSRQEISTANSQIVDHQLAPPQVIAYPFGSFSPSLFSHLSDLGYQIGFTTRPGSILCSKLNFQLPRLRPGNFPLSKLGL